ncbi:hypothetical protein BWP39_20840 [Paraburkholderia acidicola]|uniref:Uncharacterized protein n=1 Tax=Paraburkholderia acidicola TaxID=1912599 RepID=A0A2A4ENY5_9BURK|nr:hypothetical protein [Paraburkholderia acidicola]PCE22122.1 hypothetical protein BWP39_20840 [Paraburkholderia acidicola]
MKAARAICLLVLTLTSGICLADVGGLGGAAEFVFYLLLFAVLWLLLTALLVRILRKLSFPKRFGLSFLFFVSPLFFLIGWSALDQFLGTAGKRVDGVALSPVVVEGVSFPAGSRVTYEQMGGGFWHARPIGAKTHKTVMLGSLEINELEQVEGSADEFYAVLARVQTIEGWSCSEYSTVDMKMTGTQLRFESCELAAPKTINNVTWPSLTTVTRKDDGGWALSRSNGTEDHSPAQAFGMKFRVMDATYSSALVLTQWSAQAFFEDTTLGDYTFSSGRWNTLHLTDGGDISIDGGAKNIKTGEEIDCVLIQSQGHQVAPCKPHDG